MLSLQLVTTFNITMRALDSSLLTKQIRLIKNINKDIERLITCTKSIDFQNIDISDEIDDNKKIIKDEDVDYCWSETKLVGDGENFPPPISSLNMLGQPSFIFVPVRENGRMQLIKVRIRRPEILCATREDGRLRLFLIPDHCVEDNIEDEEEEEKEEQDQELVDDDGKDEKKEEFIAELVKEYEEGDEVVQDKSSYDNKDICIEGLKFPNARFMKYHEVLNHIEYHHHVHGSHQHPRIYGFCIA